MTRLAVAAVAATATALVAVGWALLRLSDEIEHLWVEERASDT